MINPAGKDKISGFLMSLTGKRLVATLLSAIGLAIIPILATMIDGNFSNSPIKVDAVDDIGRVAAYLLGLPTAILILAKYSGKFPLVLEQLKQNKVIVLTDSEWNDFKISANNIFDKSLYSKTPHFIALIITLYLIVHYFNSPVWFSVRLDSGFYFAAYLQIPVYYLTYYTYSLCIFNIIASYVVLRELFSNYKISLQPLHPDNCGGLLALGDLSNRLNIGIVVIGIISGLNIYMDHKLLGGPLLNFHHILIITGYIIGAYIVFFMPLYAAHESMKAAKFDEIKRINDYFLTVNQKLKDRLNNNANIDPRDMNDFENINKIYDLVKKMPVYPFNIATVTSFIGSLFIPILLFLVERILQSLIH